MRNRDEVKGKVEQAKGRAKQAVADVTDNPRLHDEGRTDEAAGRVRETVGTGRRKVGEVVEEVGERLKR